MRAVLNILNFVLGGFFTTLAWLLATVVSIVLVFTLPLTRSCWEITKLSLLPYGNEAIHIDELRPEQKKCTAECQRHAAECVLAGRFRLVAMPVAHC
ncbi:hypothetical protein OS11_13370 [Dickeya oryzae]